MANLICKRCGHPIVANATFALDIFEGMHWLCFHLEYEHNTDPDVSCNHSSCPWFCIEVYREKLQELGADPDEVLKAAIKRHWE
jgi:hypothetical protein